MVPVVVVLCKSGARALCEGWELWFLQTITCGGRHGWWSGLHKRHCGQLSNAEQASTRLMYCRRTTDDQAIFVVEVKMRVAQPRLPL